MVTDIRADADAVPCDGAPDLLALEVLAGLAAVTELTGATLDVVGLDDMATAVTVDVRAALVDGVFVVVRRFESAVVFGMSAAVDVRASRGAAGLAENAERPTLCARARSASCMSSFVTPCNQLISGLKFNLIKIDSFLQSQEGRIKII